MRAGIQLLAGRHRRHRRDARPAAAGGIRVAAAGIPCPPGIPLAGRSRLRLGTGHGGKLADAAGAAAVHGRGDLAGRTAFLPGEIFAAAGRAGAGGLFPLRAAAAGQRPESAFGVEFGAILAGQFEADQKHGPAALLPILDGPPAVGDRAAIYFFVPTLPCLVHLRDEGTNNNQGWIAFRSGFIAACGWGCCWRASGWRSTRSPGRDRLCSTSSAPRCRCCLLII